MVRVGTIMAASLLGASSSAMGQAADQRTEPRLRDAINPTLEWISTAIEIAGVGIIVVAIVAAFLVFVYGGALTIGWSAAFKLFRANLGRGILLGLELLVAADIIGTVAVTHSFENLAVLGLIVLIRTFLSISLEVEIEGRWPWRRAAAEAGSKDSEPPRPQDR